MYNQYTTYKDWEYRHGYSKSKDTRKTHSELRSLLTVHNKKHQYPWLKEVSSVALQSACDDAKNNYAVMVANRSDGKKASLPRRRKYGNQSFRLSGHSNVRIRQTDAKRHRGHIHIPHVGWVRYHAGKDITQINQYTPTTQVCSVCGYRGGKKPLSIRTWECEHCHTLLDRDANAVINIIDAGGHSESLNAGRASVRRLLAQLLDAVKSEYFLKDTTQVIGDNLSPLLRWYRVEKPLPK